MDIYDVLVWAYLVSLLVACGYALAAGGRSERAGAAIMLIGSVLTVPAAAPDRVAWLTADQSVMLVDGMVLIALFTLSLRSDRFWPLWMTGFHAVGFLTHAAMMFDDAIVPAAYSTAQGFWGYPMLAVMALGTAAGRRIERRN